MASLHYIIATYSGCYRENETKEYVLQHQMRRIYDILTRKKLLNLPCLIQKITIVCPTSRHPTWPLYYQKDLWLSTFEREFPAIQLYYLDYKGANTDNSYDQWIQGYLSSPNYDYNILMEDDYCFGLVRVMFDQDLVDMYRQKFKDNIGYLSTWVSNNHGHPRHSAISNGLISSDTFRRFKDPLNMYYDKSKNTTLSQLAFSFLFSDNGIPLDDITDKYDPMFWNGQKIYRCINQYKGLLISPVQFECLVNTD